MKHLHLIAVFAVFYLMLGCGGTGPANSVTNNVNSPANKPAAVTEANSKAGSTPAAGDTSSSISLATPTDAYKAAYEYRRTKNIEGLKTVLSKDALDFFKEIGEAGDKTLDEMLMEICENQTSPTNEVRNVKINGNTATLQYPDENGTNWTTMDLVKEGNVWKLTVPKVPEK